ncbi:hypothetical protein ACLKA6_010926 [Drosophila palustris]
MTKSPSYSVKVIPLWKPSRNTSIGNLAFQIVSFFYPPFRIQGARLVYEADDPEPDVLNLLLTLGSILISLLCIVIYRIYKRHYRRLR